MSTSVLPSLPGLEFPWTRAPMFKTRRQVSVSGKEVRIADWSVPRYQWTLSYSALRQGALAIPIPSSMLRLEFRSKRSCRDRRPVSIR